MVECVFNQIWDEKYRSYILQEKSKIFQLVKNVNSVKRSSHNTHMHIHAWTYIKYKYIWKYNKNTNTKNSGKVMQGNQNKTRRKYPNGTSQFNFEFVWNFPIEKAICFQHYSLWNTPCTLWSSIFQREALVSKLYISSLQLFIQKPVSLRNMRNTTPILLSHGFSFITIKQWILHVCCTFL